MANKRINTLNGNTKLQIYHSGMRSQGTHFIYRKMGRIVQKTGNCLLPLNFNLIFLRPRVSQSVFPVIASLIL